MHPILNLLYHRLVHLFTALYIGAMSQFGIATSFGRNDKYNPNELLYCTNAPITDTDLVVAHPTLPCGTRVEVTVARTMARVQAVVADRGPRHAMVDLSDAVARVLRARGGFNGKELVHMRVLP